MCSSDLGHLEIIKAILTHEAGYRDLGYTGRMNIVSVNNYTPLMYALIMNEPEKKKEILNLFLTHGAIEYDICDSQNRNIFWYVQAYRVYTLDEFMAVIYEFSGTPS